MKRIYPFWAITRCPTCKRLKMWGSVQWRRQDTAFVDNEQNWVLECRQCFAITQEYWAERWADYRGGG